jgi:glucose-6-phosphate isomerase
MISATYGEHSVAIGAAVAEARASGLMRRIRDRDHTLWKPEPDGISDRLGWLRAPSAMQKETGRIERFAQEVRAGFDDVLLLGMGGSSLAAEAFARIFGGESEAPRLRVVDTTDPDFLRDLSESTDPLRTLHIVATKSGSTVETMSAFRYFWERVAEAIEDRRGADGADSGKAEPAGESRADAQGVPGARFAAITDPGTRLASIARDRGFREIFLNPADVGGRYSALTYFGLVPAAIMGAGIGELLKRGEKVVGASLAGEDGRALGLGLALAVLAEAGRDKLTLSTSPAIAPFAEWIEQLVAESTGKEGTGIVPIVGEPLEAPQAYGADRVFVDLALADDASRVDALSALEKAGHPVVRLWLRDLYDLGGQIVLWELATAVAAARLGVHPFDQPNVEAAKARARAALDAYRDGGQLPASAAAPPAGDALGDFLGSPAPGSYVAIHAYVAPSEDTDAALRTLREALRARYRVATTAGYGPRFLHSTGQLHKGDGGRGLFVQLVSEPREDVPIPGARSDRAPAAGAPAEAGEARPRAPGRAGAGGAAAGGAEGAGRSADDGAEGEQRAERDRRAADGGPEDGDRRHERDEGRASDAGADSRRPLTFGALRDAQALGDRRALEEAGRPVIRFDVGKDAAAGILRLAGSLGGADGENAEDATA